MTFYNKYVVISTSNDTTNIVFDCNMYYDWCLIKELCIQGPLLILGTNLLKWRFDNRHQYVIINDVFVKVGEHSQTFVKFKVTNQTLLLVGSLFDCYETIIYENEKINIHKLKAFIWDLVISIMSITNSSFAIFYSINIPQWTLHKRKQTNGNNFLCLIS